MGNSPWFEQNGRPSLGRLSVALALAGAASGAVAALCARVFGLELWPAVLLAAVVAAGLTLALLLPWVVLPLSWAAKQAPAKGPLTTVDPVTHTLNRRGITSNLLEAMAQSQRYNTPLSVAVVDIERLADINAQYGTEGGDKVLEGVSATITEVLRLPDRVGRHAEDEFIVVMPQTKLPAANQVAARVAKAVEDAPVDVDGRRVPVRVKVGVAAFSKGEDLEALLSNARRALGGAPAKKASRPRRGTRKPPGANNVVA